MAKKIETPQNNSKAQLSFTLGKGTKQRFLDHCEKNMINKSQLLESFIINFFDNQDFPGMIKKQ